MLVAEVIWQADKLAFLPGYDFASDNISNETEQMTIQLAMTDLHCMQLLDLWPENREEVRTSFNLNTS